jgi:signal transduction histidine kinase
MKPIILCVNVGPALVERLAAEARALLGEDLRVEYCRDAGAARDSFRARLDAGNDVPIVVADTALPSGEREALFDEVRRRSPRTGTILLPGRGGGPAPRFSAAVGRESGPGPGRAPVGHKPARERGPDRRDEPAGARPESERRIIDTLLKLVSDKVKELENRKGELEEACRELNAETIQRLLAEREAEQTSRRLTALQNNLKNNLFIRSVLHSLINLLQVQLSLDKEENAVIGELEESLRASCAGGALEAGGLFTRLKDLRAKTDDNVRRAMMGYARAVQRSLMGEREYASASPSNLVQAVERVRLKYKDILSGEKTGRPIEFALEPAATEIRVRLYDFAIVNVVENLLTNSIRKVLEADRPARWIRLAVSEERRGNETFTVLTWSDNGGGVSEARKRSIFTGDSDKTEEGDHGVGLSDVKTTIEAAGGFIREEGVPGEGAKFVIGFPKPASGDESTHKDG